MTLTRHYTGHFKAVVTKPQNVMVMRDIACAGYVAGCNTRWFAGTPGGMNKGLAQENIQDRLSFADDVSDRYASMLAFPAHEGQFTSGQLDTVMSVTGRLLPWEVNGASTLTHESFPGGEAMYKQYQSILGLSSVHYGEDMKAAENMDFISQGSTNNATCFLGPHRKYDPFTKSFMSLIPGQGHFGPDAIPGVTTLSNPARPLAPPCAPCHLTTCPCGRTRAGVAGSRCRSRRPATRWWASSSRSTPRWCTLDASSAPDKPRLLPRARGSTHPKATSKFMCVCVLGKARPFLIIPSGGG